MRGSPCCWPSRTPRWRSAPHSTPTSWKPAGSCSTATARPSARTRTSRSSTSGSRASASARATATSSTTSAASGGFRERAPRRGSMSAQIEIREVSKSFGGVQAVSAVSLDVNAGEITSVIGPNGAGKTTLLNMVSGFYHPDRGRITLDGADLTELSPSRVAELGVARTFQNIALFKGMTVLDNLMLGRHVRMRSGVLASFVYWGFAQKEEVAHRRRVEDIIDFLKIQDLRRRPTGSLPYGLQKRVELGRALALDPKILLLDEPMGGCNHEEKEDMARFVLDVNQEWGTTVILIEHDMGVVMDISDRVAVLDMGQKIADGTPDEVRSNPQVIKAYLGEPKNVANGGRRG